MSSLSFCHSNKGKHIFKKKKKRKDRLVNVLERSTHVSKKAMGLWKYYGQKKTEQKEIPKSTHIKFCDESDLRGCSLIVEDDFGKGRQREANPVQTTEERTHRSDFIE